MTSLAVGDIRLSHFRSYHQLELALDGRPVALFGPNGAGKTNLLEAISLLSPGRGMRRARPGEIARAPDRIGWRLRAHLASRGSDHEVVTGADDAAAARKVEIDGKSAPQTTLGQIARVLWLVPVMDRLWLEGAGERRGFLDRITMSLIPDHADAALAYEKAMRERNRLLRDQVREPSWFAAVEAQMVRHGVALDGNRRAALDRLAAVGAPADGPFPRADLTLVPGEDAPDFSDAEAFARALADGRPGDVQAGRTRVGPHRADVLAVYAAKGIAARLCSTGEQKALLISLILANAAAIAADFGAPPILLLDEVAAHLDADRRAALYDQIVALNSQAFLSGTGAELFEALGDRATHLSVREAGGVSVVG